MKFRTWFSDFVHKMPHSKAHRLVVLGADRVGKTAIIEQLIFGNHVIGQVGDLLVVR